MKICFLVKFLKKKPRKFTFFDTLEHLENNYRIPREYLRIFFLGIV